MTLLKWRSSQAGTSEIGRARAQPYMVAGRERAETLVELRTHPAWGPAVRYDRMAVTRSEPSHKDLCRHTPQTARIGSSWVCQRPTRRAVVMNDAIHMCSRS